MQFMVIERFKENDMVPIDRKLRDGSRMLRAGLKYIDSWVVADDRMDTCFQLMETDDPSLFDVWLDNWRDLGTFEIYPVFDSASAAAHVQVDWDG